MKKLIIAFALMVMLAGGAVSILKWMGLGPFAQIEKPDTPAPVKEEKQLFVEADPLAIPVFQEERAAATIHIQLKIETVGQENYNTLYKAKAKLRSAYLTELHAFIPRMLKKTERIDVGILKVRLMMVTDRVMGAGVASDILIQSVTDIPNR
ncbi:MAG: hypothetical protein H7841_03995 [Magnetospirillum sp. WYHS-4]